MNDKSKPVASSTFDPIADTTANADSSAMLKDAQQRLSKAASHTEIHEIVRTVARKLCNSDGAAFVMKDGEQCL